VVQIYLLEKGKTKKIKGFGSTFSKGGI